MSEATNRVLEAQLRRQKQHDKRQKEWESALKPTTIDGSGVLRQLGQQPLDNRQILPNTASLNRPIRPTSVPGGVVADWLPRVKVDVEIPKVVPPRALPCFVFAKESSPSGLRRDVDYTRNYYLWDGKNDVIPIAIDSYTWRQPFDIVEYKRTAYDPDTGESTREVNVLGQLSVGDDVTIVTTDEKDGYQRTYRFVYEDGYLDWYLTNPNPVSPDTEFDFNCESYLMLQTRFFIDTSTYPYKVDLHWITENTNSYSLSFLSAAFEGRASSNTIGGNGYIIDYGNLPGAFSSYATADGLTAGDTDVELLLPISYAVPTYKIPIGSRCLIRYSDATLSDVLTVIARIDDTYTFYPAFAKAVNPGTSLSISTNTAHRILGSGFTSSAVPNTTLGVDSIVVGIGTFSPYRAIVGLGAGTTTAWRMRLKCYPSIAVSSSAQCSRVGSKLYGALITPDNIAIYSDEVTTSYRREELPEIPEPPCANGEYWKFVLGVVPNFIRLTLFSGWLQDGRNRIAISNSPGRPTATPRLAAFTTAIPDANQNATAEQVLTEDGVNIEFRSRKFTNLVYKSFNKIIKRIPWEQFASASTEVLIVFQSAVIKRR